MLSLLKSISFNQEHSPMIKIRKKDSIVDIVQKIDNFSGNDIILDFPIWHPVLHNQLSLKIIKNKSWKKKLVILTSDLTSRKIWKNLGIKYSIIKDKKFIEESWKNDNLIKYNFTFFEYLLFELRHLYQNIKTSLARNKNINSINKYYSKYNKSYNIPWFLFWLFISVLLLIFIFYFAVNKTYIYITPEVVVKTRAKNFVFKEKTSEISTNNEISEISKIDKKLDLSRKFTTTWIYIKDLKKAKWTALFFNETESEQQILEKTILRTPEWIMYKTLSWAIIPPAIKDNFENIIPWTFEVEIEAEIYDINGKFTWSRWNIWKDVKLSIPWLKSNSDKIYLKTNSDIKWGKDSHKKILSEVDIKNGKTIMEEKLKSESIKELSNLVKNKNQINKTDMEIFWIDNMITYSDLNINLDEKTSTGSQIETFMLDWEIKISTYIYNKINIINKLKNVIRDSILQWTERIIYIDNNSLRISDVVYKKEDPLEIKATAEIEVLVSHDFLGQNNNYVEKLKSTIRGMEKKEALTLLLNDPKISNVDIKIRPFFIKKISNINENIIFKVLD